jgi:hypothetical protein
MSRPGGKLGFVLSCEAAEIRGNLKHSHISNRFLFYRDPGHLLQAIREHASDLRLLLRSLVTLTADVDRGFSPVPRVRIMAPFRALRGVDQERLLEALRGYYQMGFHPAERAARLDEAARRFLSAIDRFVEAGGAVDAHEPLKKEALRLERELASLPTGVWLWA